MNTLVKMQVGTVQTVEISKLNDISDIRVIIIFSFNSCISAFPKILNADFDITGLWRFVELIRRRGVGEESRRE